MKLTSVLQRVSINAVRVGCRNILVLSLDTALDAKHLLVCVLVSELDLKRLPFLPELGACPWIAELACVAVDGSRTVDFSQPPLHLSELETHFLGLAVG
jgi:hypothetical protein